MKMVKRAALIIAAAAGTAALAGGGVAVASAITDPSPQIFQPGGDYRPSAPAGTAPTGHGHERDDSRDDGRPDSTGSQSVQSALLGHDAHHDGSSQNDQ